MSTKAKPEPTGDLPPLAAPASQPNAQRSTLNAQPTGNWSLSRLSGPREEVIEQVNGAQSVPAEWKSALVASITAAPADWRGVTLDAHCNTIGGGLMLNAHLKKLF